MIVRSLSRNGAVAAAAVGAATLLGLGWVGAAVLFAFFLPSTALSRMRHARLHAIADVGKQGPRDAWQVLANGGVAACCALLALRLPHVIADAGFVGAFAAASADTWGTEIGTRFGGKAYGLLNLRAMPTGISGAVTVLGTLAECVGALLVAAVAALLGLAPLLAAAVGGILGALTDSFLGATLQERRYCAACKQQCETNPHRCGNTTTCVRGISGFGNDGVNFCATLVGASVTIALVLR